VLAEPGQRGRPRQVGVLAEDRHARGQRGRRRAQALQTAGDESSDRFRRQLAHVLRPAGRGRDAAGLHHADQLVHEQRVAARPVVDRGRELAIDLDGERRAQQLVDRRGAQRRRPHDGAGLIGQQLVEQP
jgi:hypothetical protein